MRFAIAAILPAVSATPLEFRLNQVIKCWTEGLQKMKTGGKVTEMKTLIALAAILLPAITWAATDCRMIEYPERYEVVCVGDAAPASERSGAETAKPATSQPALTESRRGRLQQETMERSKAERATTIMTERRKNSLPQNAPE